MMDKLMPSLEINKYVISVSLLSPISFILLIEQSGILKHTTIAYEVVR